MKNNISEKKQKQLDEFLKSDFKAGEKVQIKNKYIKEFNYGTRIDNCKNYKIVNDTPFGSSDVLVELDEHGYTTNRYVVDSSVIIRFDYNIGVNPFDGNNWSKRIRNLSMNLDSILYYFGFDVFDLKWKDDDKYVSKKSNKTVMEMNWNPYVIDSDGNKQYYQRDLCWTLEDKQLLIESIYQSIDCGKIIIRKHDVSKVINKCDNGEDELSFYDVVDGKQRIHTIIEFLLGEFQDLHGNYYGDLSFSAQREFIDTQSISCGMIEEGSSDKDIINTFLKVNFTGKPMSKEHIDYVMKINSKM